VSAFERAASLGKELRARRRSKHLTLRDLSDQIGVSFNTLSRVERGHLPDLKNFQKIVDWLEMPADAFLDSVEVDLTTPEVIARHLRSDQLLDQDAAAQIAKLVEEMYHELIGTRARVAVHLRSAKTFTPAAGALLSEVLTDMQAALVTDESA
jgi:transcriptional regulator with XRE-family HTH domain